jgi:hypothetical protein
MIALLPCPFCGGEAQPRLDDYINGHCIPDPMFYISCENPGCGVWPEAEGKYSAGHDKIVAAWNTRAPLPDEAAAARIEELEAEVARLTNNANAIERENKWLRGNCDASPDGVHTIISEGRYRFCGKCGETITPDKLRMAERFKELDLLRSEVAELRALLSEANARIVREGMEPLGPDFERVWDENLATLYSNDPLPGKETP